ncbi:thioredoxin family protein [Candidatus Nitrosacidococcus sp. I8]|uniref:thioredoxin family protein n=1 Tax=Candidatus Nitrosacidococcus sp. I8 TaxID=2942908 RepID=UPI002226F703|nr:thioredoxin family protein [Candidatus Nitrosacidococcus sp. I8]CAH9018554.1 Thiol-disulfide oxidoreductase ResA [Candidatus Nitrosacidococcus sp. I8]
MVRTESTMLALGTKAPDFKLLEPKTGSLVSLADFKDHAALLVIFMCNHCPYVKHIGKELGLFIHNYRAKGLATVGINANDVENYPDDSPEKMVDEIKIQGYSFPYLYDESQKVAQAYKAACTPDFFLFDKNRKLVYRGQFDDSRPGNSVSVTGKDLKIAVETTLKGESLIGEQLPSVGCNIKWKPGNAPSY